MSINPFAMSDETLDNAIAKAFEDLQNYSANEEEYQRAVDNLTKLYAIRNSSLQHYSDAEAADLKHRLEDDARTFEEMQATRPFYERVDPNTLLTVAGNLFIGIAVLKYEKTGVISTRIRDFMRKI